MKGAKLAGRIAAPLAIGLTVLDAGMDVNQANKDYKAGKITDKERSNKSIGSIVEAGSTLALAAAGASTGAALGAALGSVVPLLGTAVGAAIGGTLGGITGGIAGLMSGDFMNDMGGKFSDKLHETGIIPEETRSEKLANIAEDNGAVDIGLGDGVIKSERKLRLLDSETLQALLKEETWSNKDKKTIETLLIERETTSKATIIKEEKTKKEAELALKEHKSDSIANTPFKKLSDVLATTRSGPGGKGGIGGIGGTGGQGGMTETVVSQTEKPKDMNSHNGVEGTWSNVGDEWVFYSKNYAPKKISSSLGTAPIVTPTTKNKRITSKNATPEEKEMLNQRSVDNSLRVMRKGPIGSRGKSSYKRKMELALNPKKETAKPLWDAMKPEEQKQFAKLNPYTREKNSVILKQMMSEPTGLTPASDPNIRAQNMSGIHKQNFELKTSADKPSIVPVSNVTNNNYSGGGGGGTSVITKPTTESTGKYIKGY